MTGVINNNWKIHKLNELGVVSRGRSRHRPRNEPSLYGGPYPFFQTGDIKAANLYLSKYSQTYSEKDSPKASYGSRERFALRSLPTLPRPRSWQLKVASQTALLGLSRTRRRPTPDLSSTQSIR